LRAAAERVIVSQTEERRCGTSNVIGTSRAAMNMTRGAHRLGISKSVMTVTRSDNWSDTKAV
jgi:hypothetical protein